MAHIREKRGEDKDEKLLECEEEKSRDCHLFLN